VMASSLSWLIIPPLSFLSVIVADIVLVLFVELIVRHAGPVHSSPEYDRFLEWQSKTLIISSILSIAASAHSASACLTPSGHLMLFPPIRDLH
jgi:hypothetical protein